MKKLRKYIKVNILIFIVSFVFCVIISLIFLIYDISLFTNGFAVDNDGKIYLYTTTSAKIYKDNELIDCLKPINSSKINIFTIENGNTGIFYYSDYTYKVDLDSKKLISKIKTDKSKYEKINRNNNKFTDVNGNKYTLSKQFLKLVIKRENDKNIDVVYTTSKRLLIVRYAYIIFIFMTFLELINLTTFKVNKIKKE